MWIAVPLLRRELWSAVVGIVLLEWHMVRCDEPLFHPFVLPCLPRSKGYEYISSHSSDKRKGIVLSYASHQCSRFCSRSFCRQWCLLVLGAGC